MNDDPANKDKGSISSSRVKRLQRISKKREEKKNKGMNSGKKKDPTNMSPNSHIRGISAVAYPEKEDETNCIVPTTMSNNPLAVKKKKPPRVGDFSSKATTTTTAIATTTTPATTSIKKKKVSIISATETKAKTADTIIQPRKVQSEKKAIKSIVQVRDSKVDVKRIELKRNNAKLAKMELEYEKILLRNEELQRSLKDDKEKRNIDIWRSKNKGDSNVNLSSLGITPRLTRLDSGFQEEMLLRKKVSIFTVMAEMDKNSEQNHLVNPITSTNEQKSKINERKTTNIDKWELPSDTSSNSKENGSGGSGERNDRKQEEKSFCVTICLNRGVLAVNCKRNVNFVVVIDVFNLIQFYCVLLFIYL
jgi:hypothetical protein